MRHAHEFHRRKRNVAQFRTGRGKRLRFRAREVVLTLFAGMALGLTAANWEPGASPIPAATAAAGDDTSAAFGFCRSGGGQNCVVDGDTFRMGGERIRIADIDTPETNPPRCDRERELGGQATRRLHALLNAGPFTLARIDRDEDRYGRKLRIVMRRGESLGDVLVAEGLARRWTGSRRPWC